MTSSQNTDQIKSADAEKTATAHQDLNQETFSALDAIRDEPQLRQAFEQFSEHSMRLEEAYNTLEAQFRQVSAQLHEVYCQLDEKINDLATAKHYVESLLSQMSQGVLFISQDQKILTCNQVMSRWLGQSEKELRAFRYSEKFPDDLFGFSMKKALETEQGPQTSYTQSSGDETLPPLEISTNFITYFSDQDETEQLVPQKGLCILARDIPKEHPPHSSES